MLFQTAGAQISLCPTAGIRLRGEVGSGAAVPESPIFLVDRVNYANYHAILLWKHGEARAIVPVNARRAWFRGPGRAGPRGCGSSRRGARCPRVR